MLIYRSLVIICVRFLQHLHLSSPKMISFYTKCQFLMVKFPIPHISLQMVLMFLD